jgi:hypothetical protein
MSMRRLTIGWLFGSGAVALVTLSVACGPSAIRGDPEEFPTGGDTSPAPGDAQAAGSAIDGVYTERHTVRTVEGPSALVDDVVEIARYDAAHLFFRIVTRFDIGHSCSVYGIATQVDQVFVYRAKQPPADSQQPCTLKFEVTADELRITDRLEPNGPSTCRESCGIRATLAHVAFSRKHRRPIQDLAGLKKSPEFLAAVEELNMKK